ncbi:hypothetical protein [Marimonas arenosa]|uniref:Uncharacterized protein n=1 Tax=Marimonas arenosa TaxID=1795305 RepID=A0AAE4B5Y0_9RHOB|nr:hypothetical protein [Marimonas arenosa]MDQ2092463.1 hypothetical protein [Marimonas arenosa]
MKRKNPVLGLVAALLSVQLFDIIIHVATDQVEPIRIASNALLGLWAIGTVFSLVPAKAATIAITLYLILNGWFVALHGVTNQDQGGAVRVTLFVLVGLSTALALWLKNKSHED